MKCAPYLPATSQKWQSPSQCSRVPRPVTAWGDRLSVGKAFSTYFFSQDTTAGTELLESCCSSLAVISQGHVVFPFPEELVLERCQE